MARHAAWRAYIFSPFSSSFPPFSPPPSFLFLFPLSPVGIVVLGQQSFNMWHCQRCDFILSFPHTLPFFFFFSVSSRFYGMDINKIMAFQAWGGGRLVVLLASSVVLPCSLLYPFLLPPPFSSLFFFFSPKNRRGQHIHENAEGLRRVRKTTWISLLSPFLCLFFSFSSLPFFFFKERKRNRAAARPYRRNGGRTVVAFCFNSSPPFPLSLPLPPLLPFLSFFSLFFPNSKSRDEGKEEPRMIGIHGKAEGSNLFLHHALSFFPSFPFFSFSFSSPFFSFFFLFSSFEKK